MQRTLLSHILNEEILLPAWLTHHKKLFTHGIIFDCGSTDKSLQIIKEICPTWTIKDISGEDISNEKLDIAMIQSEETKINGWKCCLNVTEYLVIDNLEKYLLNYEQNNPKSLGVKTNGVIIVDRFTNIDHFNDINFLLKKDFGYLEFGKTWNNYVVNGTYPYANYTDRSRLLHKNLHGRYTFGRHGTTLPVKVDPLLYLAWVGKGSPELYHK